LKDGKDLIARRLVAVEAGGHRKALAGERTTIVNTEVILIELSGKHLCPDPFNLLPYTFPRERMG